ncbi:hypothetical protein [Sulfurimonas sp.]|jgi:hypothetical protein|uniref:hypothetical protein n=1 Tax=Sulfurimonas sp. TaxID=2022749 RepID=UPI0025FB6F42|nr:hypothetical protein [Sulfurimonas sp.]MBT5935594.1 hypothetical protein [Sulfurimonas sp.]
MDSFNKNEFKEYLTGKVKEDTARLYASDMQVCVNAFEKIKLYKNRNLAWALEDFFIHKDAIKNYLQDEFLVALTEVGSNDSGLYDSLSSKAKHYLQMLENKA